MFSEQDDKSIKNLLDLLGHLNYTLEVVSDKGLHGEKVVFSMITTTFNNICEKLKVPNNNTYYER